MNIIRKIAIGFMIGGGLGAKIGAYLTVLFETTYIWPVVERATELGIVMGCIISGVIVFFPTGTINRSQPASFTEDRVVAA